MRLLPLVLLLTLLGSASSFAQSDEGPVSGVWTPGVPMHQMITPPANRSNIVSRPAATSSATSSNSTASRPSTPFAPPVPIVVTTPPTAAMLARGEAAANKPQVSGGWSRPGIIGGNTVIYASFMGGAVDDRLMSITTAWANSASLHETVTDTQGVVRMLPALAGFALPARKPVTFAPGGKHIMVMGLKRELRASQTFPVIFNFEKSGPVRVMIQVRADAAQTTPQVAPQSPMPPMDHMSMEHMDMSKP